VITTITSSGPITGAQSTNRIDDIGVAARPASCIMPAPRIAAWWLVPVPTIQMRRARWRDSAAVCTCSATLPDDRIRESSSGWERICCSRFLGCIDMFRPPCGAEA
jgi:hypothetical protein